MSLAIKTLKVLEDLEETVIGIAKPEEIGSAVIKILRDSVKIKSHRVRARVYTISDPIPKDSKAIVLTVLEKKKWWKFWEKTLYPLQDTVEKDYVTKHYILALIDLEQGFLLKASYGVKPKVKLKLCSKDDSLIGYIMYLWPKHKSLPSEVKRPFHVYSTPFMLLLITDKSCKEEDLLAIEQSLYKWEVKNDLSWGKNLSVSILYMLLQDSIKKIEEGNGKGYSANLS